MGKWDKINGKQTSKRLSKLIDSQKHDKKIVISGQPEQSSGCPVFYKEEFMAERKDQMKELTDRLEEGVRQVFESGKYEEYLRVMSKFHHYSYRNTLLIAMQRSDATMVAGYESWKKKFGRQVNKGEKAIKILAPSPYRTKKKMEVIDRNTQKPVRREDGTILTEEVEVTVPAFRVTNVFDINVKSFIMLSTSI